MTIDKRFLSEADIRTKYITPAIELAGWDNIQQILPLYAYGL